MLLLALAGGNPPLGRVGIRSAQAQQLLSAHIPGSKGEQLKDILTWDGTKALFLEWANRYMLRSGIGRLCRVDEPRGRIREMLPAVEGTLRYQEELAARAPQGGRAIQASTAPFEADSG